MAKKKKKDGPKFNPKGNWGCGHDGDKKFIVQDRNMFTYAEAKGPHVEGQGRALSPVPKFIMTMREWENKKAEKEYEKAQLTAMAAAHELDVLKKKLKAEGVLDDTS